MNNETSIDSWRLKALATSISHELQQQCGLNEFYSIDDVNAACDARNVIGHLRACAIGMFVQPEDAGSHLRDYGISDPAAEWRKILAAKLFYSDHTGIEVNPSQPMSFHDCAPPSHFQSGFSSAPEGDCGSDGGGD